MIETHTKTAMHAIICGKSGKHQENGALKTGHQNEDFICHRGN